MATPRLPRNLPGGNPVSWIRALERRIALIEQRSPFTGTGLSAPASGVTQVDGSLIVQNGEAKSGNFAAGSAGWHLDHGGNAEFNALTIRGGIIGNDALTSPVGVGAIYDSLTNFALTTVLTNIRTTNITVPSGFTKAAVSIVVRVYAINPNTTGGYDTHGGDYLYGEANIQGFNGYALPLAVSGSGGSGTNISPFSTVLSGLTAGSTFNVQIAASTNYANWAANASNTAEVSGSVLWFR
jgi:hypothetical protein